MEDALLLEEMAEEDEELDLYNEMTFGLGKTSGESWCWRDLPALGGSIHPGGHCQGVHPSCCVLLPPLRPRLRRGGCPKTPGGTGDKP